MTAAVTDALPAGEAPAPSGVGTTFRVQVKGFEGPFDLLLSLVAKHELDIGEVSLAAVTDDFLAHLRTLSGGDDLEQASSFLLVGATLLDLKIASLLPAGETVDAESVALLEARDLLFARLLQYRAYRRSAAWFADALAAEAGRHPGVAAVDEPSRAATSEPVPWTLTAEDFAALAEGALAPRTPPTVALDHLHVPLVSLRGEAAAVAALLKGGAALTFVDLAGAEAEAPVVVARFLAVLELYRHGALVFDQLEPLGALVLRWTAEDWDESVLDALGEDWDG